MIIEGFFKTCLVRFYIKILGPLLNHGYSKMCIIKDNAVVFLVNSVIYFKEKMMYKICDSTFICLKLKFAIDVEPNSSIF